MIFSAFVKIVLPAVIDLFLCLVDQHHFSIHAMSVRYEMEKRSLLGLFSLPTQPADLVHGPVDGPSVAAFYYVYLFPACFPGSFAFPEAIFVLAHTPLRLRGVF